MMEEKMKDEIIKLEKLRKKKISGAIKNVIDARDKELIKFNNIIMSNKKWEPILMRKKYDLLDRLNDFNIGEKIAELYLENYCEESINYEQLNIKKIKKFVEEMFQINLSKTDVYFFDEKEINYSEGFMIECGREEHAVFLPKENPYIEDIFVHELGHVVFTIASRRREDVLNWFSHQFWGETVAHFVQLKYIEMNGNINQAKDLLKNVLINYISFLFLKYKPVNFKEFNELEEIQILKKYYSNEVIKQWFEMYSDNLKLKEYYYLRSSFLIALKLIDKIEVIQKIIDNSYRDKDIFETLKIIEISEKDIFDFSEMDNIVTSFLKKVSKT